MILHHGKRVSLFIVSDDKPELNKTAQELSQAKSQAEIANCLLDIAMTILVDETTHKIQRLLNNPVTEDGMTVAVTVDPDDYEVMTQC